MGRASSDAVRLPAPRTTGDVGVERALHERRSVREFSGEALSLAQLGQLVWAAQGVTRAGGYRTAPSAGALYPLELVVVAGHVEGLAAGVHRYDPPTHTLTLVSAGDRRRELAAAALHQDWLRRAPVTLVVAAVVERTARKYGERAERYVAIEAGAAAENAALEAVALGLGTTFVGAFDDGQVAALVGLRAGEQPLLLLPVGRPE